MVRYLLRLKGIQRKTPQLLKSQKGYKVQIFESVGKAEQAYLTGKRPSVLILDVMFDRQVEIFTIFDNFALLQDINISK